MIEFEVKDMTCHECADIAPEEIVVALNVELDDQLRTPQIEAITAALPRSGMEIAI